MRHKNFMENLETQFCHILLEKKLLSPQEISMVQALQDSLLQKGMRKSIWEILVEKKFLSSEKAEEILHFLKNEMATAPGVSPFPPPSHSLPGPSRTFSLPGYKTERLLGHGGMGDVYQAVHIQSGRRVALKVLSASLSSNPKALLRLQREAQNLKKLNHPHIVKFYGLGAFQEIHYLVIEFVEGSTVAQELERGKIFSEQEALGICLPLCQALDHASSQNLVHRDIKPGNILLDGKNIPKLCDLGLSRSDEDSSITTTGSLLGTPFYMAPEIITNPREADGRSDIYSLGATLYHMVTGKPPFYTREPGELFASILSPQVADPRKDNPELSPWMCHLLQKMMDKNPDRRFPTARNLYSQLLPPED